MMKMTSAMRKAINAAAREAVGGSAVCEIGVRETATGSWSANALLWVPGADLGDLNRLADTKVIGEVPGMPGIATLDVYVYVGSGNNRELDRNLYVVISEGKVVAVGTQYQDNRNDASQRFLGMEFCR